MGATMAAPGVRAASPLVYMSDSCSLLGGWRPLGLSLTHKCSGGRFSLSCCAKITKKCAIWSLPLWGTFHNHKRAESFASHHRHAQKPEYIGFCARILRRGPYAWFVCAYRWSLANDPAFLHLQFPTSGDDTTVGRMQPTTAWN